MNDVASILDQLEAGKAKIEDLLPLVYEELRKLARAKLSHEPSNQTLQATALAHEAYLRLMGAKPESWANRAHFFAAAAESMRRILIDRARHRRSLRAGGGKEHIALDEFEIAAPAGEEELIAVHEALEKFALQDPSKAELVKLKYFVGLSTKEAATILGISEATAKRHWTFARAWLFREITYGA